MELLSVLYFLLFTIAILTLKSLKNRSQKLPPGPPRYPIIGNLHLLISKKVLPHRRLADLASKYGRVMTLQLGEVTTIVVTSADMAREIMKTHDAVFCNRPELMVGNEVFYQRKDIVFAPYGENWRQLRKLSTLELFTAKRVESFRSIREEEANNMINFIATHQIGCDVNLSELFFGLTCDFMWRATFGNKGKDQAAFRAWIGGLTQTCTGFCPADVYPSVKLLKLIGKGKFQKFTKESDRIFDPIIEEHLHMIKQGIVGEHLIDVLLRYHEDNVAEGSDLSLSTGNIKGVIVELLGGGSENSATTLEWTMAELLKNPRILEKVQAEVREVYKNDDTVDETNLHKLNYLKLVVRESLRLHPPVPMLVPRESMEKCEINSYKIPSKTRVVINAWGIARDPEYWSEPEKFNPERFKDSTVDYLGQHFEFLPFGAGRRKCPGINLGMASVELPLALLLYHFNWKLPDGVQTHELNMDESYGITMRRKYPLHAVPTPRPA